MIAHYHNNNNIRSVRAEKEQGNHKQKSAAEN